MYSETPPYTATSVIRSPRYYGPFSSCKKPSLISYFPVWVKGKNVPCFKGQSPQTRTKLYTLFYDREVKKPYAVQRHILVKAI